MNPRWRETLETEYVAVAFDAASGLYRITLKDSTVAVAHAWIDHVEYLLDTNPGLDRLALLVVEHGKHMLPVRTMQSRVQQLIKQQLPPIHVAIVRPHNGVVPLFSSLIALVLRRSRNQVRMFDISQLAEAEAWLIALGTSKSHTTGD